MIIKSLDHLRLISNKVAGKVSQKDCIFLIGEIGVGKTTFTRYSINYLQEKRGEKITEVLSPTFNLLYEYDLKDIKIMHYDLYRLKNEKDKHEHRHKTDFDLAKRRMADTDLHKQTHANPARLVP